jgi:hypothetical protein
MQEGGVHRTSQPPGPPASGGVSNSTLGPAASHTLSSTHESHGPVSQQHPSSPSPTANANFNGGSTFVVDAAMMVENRGADGNGTRLGAPQCTKPRRLLTPLFHVTECDATITAIECGPPNSGVMAFALSTGDVYVCRAPSGEGGIARGSGRSVDWAPVHIGAMPTAVTQLAWASPCITSTYRCVLHLVCCCPGRGVKVFTNDSTAAVAGGNSAQGAPSDAAKQGWSEETVEVDDCVAVAWSSSSPVTSSGPGQNPLTLQHELSLVCVSGKQRIVCCQRRDEGYGVWVEAYAYSGTGGAHAAASQWVPSADAGTVAGTSAPKAGQQAPKRSTPGHPTKDVSCVAVSCDACAGAPAGNMLAVGDYDGWVRVFEAPTLQGTARQGGASGGAGPANGSTSGPLTLLQLHHSTLVALSSAAGLSAPAPVVTSPMCGGVRHVAWAAAQGRSFAPLAYVAGTDLVVVLVANALSSLLDNTIAIGTVLGYRRVVLDEEVFKVTWNPSGTRITTSHADGTVRVYCLTTTARDTRRARANSSAAMPVHQTGASEGPQAVDGHAVFPLVERYSVGVEEMSRSVAPYAADPLASLRENV